MSALKAPLARRSRPRARVEIIPLIDVIFFLLATFVLFAMTRTRMVSLEADFPKTTGEESADVLRLRVSDRGTLYWDDELITLAELPPRLADLKHGAVPPRIMISSDPSALVGDATNVLDAVRHARIEQVTFDTRPPAFSH